MAQAAALCVARTGLWLRRSAGVPLLLGSAAGCSASFGVSWGGHVSVLPCCVSGASKGVGFTSFFPNSSC